MTLDGRFEVACEDLHAGYECLQRVDGGRGGGLEGAELGGAPLSISVILKAALRPSSAGMGGGGDKR